MTIFLTASRAAACLICLCFLGRDAFAEPIEIWPQFRGAGGQGQLGDVSLPQTWDETTGIVWKTDLPGLGHSSPVHDGKTIWLTTATDQGKSLRVQAVDAVSGRQVQDIEVFEPGKVEDIHHDNSYASPSPVLLGTRLFVHFGHYGTACLETTDGSIVWRNESLPISHEGGPGSSPVLFEDLLIVTLDGADVQKLVALDIATGAIRWQTKRSAPQPDNPTEKRAFSTPLLYSEQGQTILISAGAHQCHAYNPSNGEELWHVAYNGFSNVPRPVSNAQACYICTGFYDPQLWAISLNGTGNVTDTHVTWKFKGSVPETPSPLLFDDKLALLSNKGLLTVLDTHTGKRLWGIRIGGNFSSSPFSANGLLYLCSEEGDVKIVDPKLAKPKIIAINHIDGRIMATPAVIGSDLLLRTGTSLYRIH
ncbi:outer membrane protein assembly factor BamB family protein [Planctomicrobium piriforme]|uniref:Pyrrolo-quinoline quinone repeat domain-containing protein n=1 Tax=Planctomicrobium piriforme TaxID=1576369 RepID=A0A1I3KTJ0_9PLAN|nr:PQQ-binding-like beta-propeller repeat protein [Planctomicrobium piriforme]SFI75714.1 hypothetical protein SAMN05421753_11238 [Planctomicrobium piriforme]